MNRLYLLLVSLTLLASACKKEVITENEKELPSVTNRELTNNTARQICYGNSWENDQVFYPNWYYQPHGFASDADPFVYNNKVYVPDCDNQQVRIFNGTGWQTLASNVPVNTNYQGFSFTIGNRGFTGVTGGATTGGKFYEYNFATNGWTRKADCPLFARPLAAHFSIGTKGYIAGGLAGDGESSFKELWEYNSNGNTWSKKADMPVDLYDMSWFVLGNKGYIVNGRKYGAAYSSTLFEYDPASNSWAVKAQFPGQARKGSVAFVIDGKAYCGGGNNASGPLSDYYRYDPSTNSWTQVASMSLYFMEKPVYGFSINSRGYGVYHHMANDNVYTVKYTPLICTEN